MYPSRHPTEEGVMSEAASAPAAGGELGERRLGTIHAVAQALAIGPMFSTAVVLGFVSAPVTGAGFNTALAVLVAGLGVLAIAYAISLFARQYQGAGRRLRVPRTGRPSRGRHPHRRRLLHGHAVPGRRRHLPRPGHPHERLLDASTSRRRHVPAWWLLALLFLALVLVLNYIGVRIAIGAMLTFAALSFTPMLILARRDHLPGRTTRSRSSTPARPRFTPSSTA